VSAAPLPAPLPVILRGLREHYAQTFGVRFIDPRDPAIKFLRDLVRMGATAAVQEVGRQTELPVERLAGVLPNLDGVSMSLGPLILLSDAAVADPREEIDTVTHETQHSIDTASGLPKAGIDYLFGELRAHREARANVAGRFAKMLVTGETFTAADVLADLRNPIYHGLTVRELELAEDVVNDNLLSIESLVCPPITAAKACLQYLQTHHRDAIVFDAWRNAP
jgi:hypothetical protein